MRFKSSIVALLAVIGLAGCGGGAAPLTPQPSSTVVHASTPSRLYATSSLKNGAKAGYKYGGRSHKAGFGAPTSQILKAEAAARGSFSSTGVFFGYDAVTQSYIPKVPGEGVGCYATGPFQNCVGAGARFPGEHIITISTFAGPVAHCQDNEPGDATPSQAPGFVAAAKPVLAKWHQLPCIYADAYHWTMPGGVRAYLNANHYVDGRDYLSWVASWDGQRIIPVGYDGHQFNSGCCTDQNLWSNKFIGYTPKPPPPPAPKNYVWFTHPSPAAGLTGNAVAVSYQGKTYQAVERTLVEQYDQARSKPQSGSRLKYEARLRYELHQLAIHLNRIAQGPGQAHWNVVFHRFGRIDGELDRAMGNVVASWAAAIAWGKTHNTSRWLR